MAQPVSMTLQRLGEALRAYQARDLRKAAAICTDLARIKDDPRVLGLLARVQMEMRNEPAAAATARRAVALAPGDAGAWYTLATSTLHLGEFAESEAAWQAALRAKPGDLSLLAGLAQTHMHRGDYEQAAEVLRPALDSPAPAPEPLACFARIAPRIGRAEEALRLLAATLAQPGLQPRDAVNLLFLQADLLDQAGRYDDAFAAAQRANNLKLPRPGEDAYAAAVEAMLRAWTPEVFDTVPVGNPDTQTPVFIVGMPRSGTSLVEQILASHPAVTGAGELTLVRGEVEALQPAANPWKLHLTEPKSLRPDAMRAAAGRLLDGIVARGAGRERVSDKNPLNFMHLGLIARLYPRARLIHCRRDALDTCLSCYLQNFAGPHIFNAELAMLGRWHRRYQRVMDHWRTLLGDQMLEVQYEELAASPTAISQRMVEFLGLAWDERCLRFHETSRPTLTPSVAQVRRPMYASAIGRWKNYAAHLGPLRAALEA